MAQTLHYSDCDLAGDSNVVLRGIDQPDIPVHDLGAILIAAPHPDDETLGCGGILAKCARWGFPVVILAMTNGEASHPGDTKWQSELGRIRQREQQDALAALGLSDPDIISLNIPDGKLAELDGQYRQDVIQQIGEIVQSRNVKTVFLPAIDDRHADHQETACLFTPIVSSGQIDYAFSYQIWPPFEKSPHVCANEIAYSLDIADELDVKHCAVQKHQSQLGAIRPPHAEGFLMPEELLNEKLRNQESYSLIRNFAEWSSRVCKGQPVR